MSWNVNEPNNQEWMSSGPARIRTLKEDLESALRAGASEGVESVFPGADADNPVYYYRGLKGETSGRPEAPVGGLYYNTTTKSLQRSNGTAWEDFSTIIPSGTRTFFFQQSAPIGWVKLTTHNNRALRVVSDVGGGVGGTRSPSAAITHTHTANPHTHALNNHSHTTPIHYTPTGATTYNIGIANSASWGQGTGNLSGVASAISADISFTTAARNFMGTINIDDGGTYSNSGQTAPTLGNNTASAYKYIDIIFCEKV